MTVAEVQPAARPIHGVARPPGDKSISHRAALVAALASGRSSIRNFSSAVDCAATLAILSSLGVSLQQEADALTIEGRAGRGFDPSTAPLDCGRSGTTMRLSAGVLAGDPGPFVLTGHAQLLGRPMERVARPLRLMGATVETGPQGHPPLTIRGGTLRGIEYRLPVASAQVKSAILLAGLRANRFTTVIESLKTRDHTERLLRVAGIRVEGGAEGLVTVWPGVPAAFDLTVPGDVSSAAALIAAAALVPGSDLRVEGLGLNPSRTRFLSVLRRMGAWIEVERLDGLAEPAGDLRVRHAPLRAVRVGPEDVPGVIDELPLIGLLATQAEGVTEVLGAAELRVKESDRISGLVTGLRALGADVHELPEGFVVRGPAPLSGGRCDARADHRLAMTFTLAGLIAAGPVGVEGLEFVGDSFPGFVRTLDSVR